MNFDAFANLIAGIYELYVFSLRGVYFSSVSSGANSGAELKIKRTKLDIMPLLVGFREQLRIAVESQHSGSSDDPVSASADRLMNQIDTIAVATAYDTIKQLRATMSKGAIGVSNVGPLAQLAQSHSILFQSLDTAGRKWDSIMLVRLMARAFAVNQYFESRVEELAASGETLAVAAKGSDFRVVFSIDGSSGGKYPDEKFIRESMFHPNSSARIERYVPD